MSAALRFGRNISKSTAARNAPRLQDIVGAVTREAWPTRREMSSKVAKVEKVEKIAMPRGTVTAARRYDLRQRRTLWGPSVSHLGETGSPKVFDSGGIAIFATFATRNDGWPFVGNEEKMVLQGNAPNA